MTVFEPYARAWRYALACPLLFVVPGVIEMVQHAAEARAGFYVSIAAMKAAEHDPLRMVLGHAKVIALFLVGYWAIRFWAFGDDPRAARRLDRQAITLFVPVMAWSLFWLVLVQDGPILAGAIGLPVRPIAMTLALLVFAMMAFEVCLAAWKVAAVTGDGRVGFVRSIRLTHGSYWWALGVTLAATMPLMIVHYALAFAALGRSTPVTALVLGLDSLLVAYMAPLMAAANYVIARRVTERAARPLALAQ